MSEGRGWEMWVGVDSTWGGHWCLSDDGELGRVLMGHNLLLARRKAPPSCQVGPEVRKPGGRPQQVSSARHRPLCVVGRPSWPRLPLPTQPPCLSPS